MSDDYRPSRFSLVFFAQGVIGQAVRRFIEGPFNLVLRCASFDYNITNVLEKRAIAESADYAERHMANAMALRSREALWDLAIRDNKGAGLHLEFGVFRGASINYFAKRMEATLYGFDSFEGLKEDWGGTAALKGTFDLGGKLPKVRSNVMLIKGWFDQTLPDFLESHPGYISLVYFDCDTYESTKCALELCGPRLNKESVIIMDEYHGYRGFKQGQMKAWAEFVAANNLEYTYVAFNRYSAMLRII